MWTCRAAALVALCALLPSPSAAAPHGGVRITDNLYGTRFIDAQHGWAVGGFGTIFRTVDGGETWQPQVSRTMEPLFSVAFADEQHGWVVGRTGIILYTANGGETWERQPTGSDKHLFKVAALDPQHAWAVGDWGAILTTRDGGKTWENRSSSRDVILNSMSWPDAQHGWIVGEAGTILVTSDGGTTWTEQSSGAQKSLFGVSFTDAQHGWVVGLDGLILRTADGGRTWQVQHGDTEVSALEQVGVKEASENPSLYDVAVAGRYGYAVGDNGSVFASDDSGQTWRRRDVPDEANLRWIRAASLVPGTHGLLVGANGLTIDVAANQLRVVEQGADVTEAAH